MTTTAKTSHFAQDTLRGLSSEPKYLLSKYFYDDNGSRIFQQIMHMPSYYLTHCEHEIFSRQAPQINHLVMRGSSPFRLIELGPGDGLKSLILLKDLEKQKTPFIYMPVDISSHAIRELTAALARELNGISIEEKTGDYFRVMRQLASHDNIRKVVLFLGANIGNFSADELDLFMKQLSELTQTGDRVLIGFDLKKSPYMVQLAYDDPQGLTRAFNLNHLVRINRELQADFDTGLFEHHCSYDPLQGTMKSYLISRKAHRVHVGALERDFFFKAWESIFMECSKKYDPQEINQLARHYGFRVEHTFFDSRKYFADSLWIK